MGPRLEKAGLGHLRRDCVSITIPFLVSESLNPPKASQAQPVESSCPLSHFSMETMRTLFLILLALRTLFLVLAFAIETSTQFFPLNVTSLR